MIRPRSDTATASRQEPLSTTHAELRRWRLGLLAGTVLVAVCTMVVFGFARSNVNTVRDSGQPAVVYSLDAEDAVVSANKAVATNFRSPGDIALTGAGRDYQAQVDLATQSLEQVAGVNQAGTDGSQAIQSVDGELATYMELIGHADADYAQGETIEGATAAWHAAQLMEGGVLPDLKTLRGDELIAVNTRETSFWTSWFAVLVWLGPVVSLLVALVLAQAYLSRRFQRTYNWPLVIASALVLVIGAGSGLLIAADSDVAAAGTELHALVAQSEAATTGTDVNGMTAMLTVVTNECAAQHACGPTIAKAEQAYAGYLAKAPDRADHLDTATGELDSAATESWLGYLFLLLVASAGVAVLVVAGFRPRINEYRFQL